MDTGINPHISLDNQKKLFIIIMKKFLDMENIQ